MLSVSIKPSSEEALFEEFQLAKSYGDIVEIRLDAFSELPYRALQRHISEKSVLISTGERSTSIDEYLRLASLQPDYLDIPVAMPKELFDKIQHLFPDVSLIASYHNYEETPNDLEAIFEYLHSYPKALCKCVCKAQNSLDALRMLVVLSKQTMPTIGFCMGEVGAFSRVLAPLFGSQITYAGLPDKPTAEGQLTVPCKVAKKGSRIYALVGNPVVQSRSHITHNALCKNRGLPAVYVKIQLNQEEIEEAVRYFHLLDFSGLSVTTPLKSYFGGNTVLLGEELVVTDTDGPGMLDAIEAKKKVSGQKLLIVGAGMTAFAIGREAHKRGAEVIFTNRTSKKAEMLADLIGCKAILFDESIHNLAYDLIVNATTVGMNDGESIINEVRKGVLVADVISTKETLLLQLAKKRGCELVYGREMWLRQAAYQFTFWESLDYQDTYEELCHILG